MKKIRAKWKKDSLGYINLVPEDGGLRLGSVDPRDYGDSHAWWPYGCWARREASLAKAKAALLKACNATVAPKRKKRQGVKVKWKAERRVARVGDLACIMWDSGRWLILRGIATVAEGDGGKRAAEAALKRLLKKESKR